MTIAVVGAGMSGLSVTHYLESGGADVRTFEAASEPGGIVETAVVDGHVLERGPQRLRRSNPVAELIETLTLEDEVVVGHDDQPLYAYYDGDLRPMPLSVREAVTTDLLSWRGKARVLLEPLTGPAKPGETVETFLTRKFGEEAASRFMGPLYSGLYGSDPDEMYVEYSLGRALEHVGIADESILLFAVRKLLEGVEKPDIVSFENGLQTLPWAMYEAHEAVIELETPVTSVERDGDGFLVHTDSDSVTVDRVVFTTPAPTTAALLENVDPGAASV
ncbi:MAG: protoporphyrinogen oxidase, partial [archaeon]